MPLVQKPRREMLQNAQRDVQACRAGGFGVTNVVFLPLYLEETDITLEELGITQGELNGWLAAADELPIECFEK